MDRTFKVVGKNLKGNDEKPYLTLKNDYGDKLTWTMDEKDELDAYEIGQILTVRIVKEQQTLA